MDNRQKVKPFLFVNGCALTITCSPPEIGYDFQAKIQISAVSGLLHNNEFVEKSLDHVAGYRLPIECDRMINDLILVLPILVCLIAMAISGYLGLFSAAGILAWISFVFFSVLLGGYIAMLKRMRKKSRSQNLGQS